MMIEDVYRILDKYGFRRDLLIVKDSDDGSCRPSRIAPFSMVIEKKGKEQFDYYFADEHGYCKSSAACVTEGEACDAALRRIEELYRGIGSRLISKEAELNDQRIYYDPLRGDYYLRLIRWQAGDPEWGYAGKTVEDAIKASEEYGKELNRAFGR